MAHLCSTQALFDLSRTMAAPLLAGTTFPWEALAGLEKFIFQLGESLHSPGAVQRLFLNLKVQFSKSQHTRSAITMCTYSFTAMCAGWH